jgi:BMFP domain-containing protein YqiC
MSAMIDFDKLDELARRLSSLVPPSVREGREELQENFKSVLQSGLAKLDLVTREEFEVQRAVLLPHAREARRAAAHRGRSRIADRPAATAAALSRSRHHGVVARAQPCTRGCARARGAGRSARGRRTADDVDRRLPQAAVREAKDRVRAAIHSAQFEFPNGRITVNLAPADLPKSGDGSTCHRARRAGGERADSERGAARCRVLGELGLTGELRAVDGVLPATLAAAEAKRRLIVPAAMARKPRWPMRRMCWSRAPCWKCAAH